MKRVQQVFDTDIESNDLNEIIGKHRWLRNYHCSKLYNDGTVVDIIYSGYYPHRDQREDLIGKNIFELATPGVTKQQVATILRDKAGGEISYVVYKDWRYKALLLKLPNPFFTLLATQPIFDNPPKIIPFHHKNTIS